jgi:predicted metal-binding membrane protein
MLAREQADDGGGGPRLGRDRPTIITAAAVVGLGVLAWASVIADASMTSMPGMEMSSGGMDDMGGRPFTAALSLPSAAAFLASWGVMMAAMMLPSAAPMVALYGAVHRHADRTGQGGIPTFVFALVYLFAWLLFGIPVYGAQLVVDALLMANPMAASLLPYLLAVVLVAAGAYQFSPLKAACLRACQSPLGFLMARWRPGYRGTLRLGLSHAAYCIGCCWALMVVLVAAGAMGLHWVLLIAALVAAEKLLAGGIWIARTAGALLVVLGALVAVNPGLYMLLRGMPT